MPTIDATPKGASANSYSTQAAATLYFDERLNVTEWTAAVSDDKDRALIMATRLLDEFFDWDGYMTDRTTPQALMWPRSSLEDREGLTLDPDAIPDPIFRACCELALFLLKRDRLGEPELLGQGFSKAKLGPMDAVIDPKMVLEFIPRHILPMVDHWGTLRSSANRGGTRVMDVRRT